MSCNKNSCKCDKTLAVSLPKSGSYGAWLVTKGNESVHLYVNEFGSVIGYNSPNLDELGASAIALVFKDNELELQFFKDNNDKATISHIKVDKTLAYNLLLDVLNTLREKAIKLETELPIVK